jgi:hypothetical protein
MQSTKDFNSIQILKTIGQYILSGLLFALSIQTYFEEKKMLSSIFFLVCGIYLLPFLSPKLKVLMPFLNDWLWRRILAIVIFLLGIYFKL